MFAEMAAIARGIIAQFKGAIADIPAGWTLCDGTLGTIDLTDKFIVCAGSTYSPADTGGSVNHLHIISLDLDEETLDSGTDVASGSGYNADLVDVEVVGNTGSSDTRPPYYALAFVMKL